MAGIHGGQQANIFLPIPPGKSLDGALAADHASGLAILVNEPRELLPRIPTHLLQIAADETFVGFREGQVLKPDHTENMVLAIQLRNSE